MSRTVDKKLVTVVMANGTSLTAAIPLHGYRFAGFISPSAWTTAAITFQASYDGVNFYPYNVGGTAWSITSPSLDTWYEYSPYLTSTGMWAPNYIKLRSGTSGAPVNQTADRTLQIILVGAIA